MLKELLRRKSVARILEEAEREKMESEHGGSLKRTLRVRDLTAFGIPPTPLPDSGSPGLGAAESVGIECPTPTIGR
jgi:hypothetical protein